MIKIYAIFATVLLLIAGVWGYGHKQLIMGEKLEAGAIAKNGEIQRKKDSDVIVPKIRSDANERQAKTREAIAAAAKQLPPTDCFNQLITADDAKRLRNADGPNSPTSAGPTAD